MEEAAKGGGGGWGLEYDYNGPPFPSLKSVDSPRVKCHQTNRCLDSFVDFSRRDKAAVTGVTAGETLQPFLV